ncbi:MAG TPA: hypothetical protein VFV87_20910, partial [Pirellulaceae bacterium]|nr:hypothetical protein [Pirellulaceae bacterium]
MLATLTAIDYGVVALFLAALVAAVFYFSSRQKDTGEFFLAGRSLDWLPLGMSLAAILVSLLGFSFLPGQAYETGWKCWIVVLPFWLALPLIAYVAIPLFRGLGVVSLYEYLELRFDARVRLVASVIFVAWRLVWLAGAIYLPCLAIRLAAGWSVPVWLIVIPVGGLATLGAFLGGMREVTWSGLLKFGAVVAGTVTIIAGILLAMEDGPSRVAEVTRGLG